MRPEKKVLPLPVQRALRELGLDLRNARVRRRVKAETLAARCSVSRTTIVKLEHGQDVMLGTLATVLLSLGLLDRLNAFLDLRHELTLSEERLPQRVR